MTTSNFQIGQTVSVKNTNYSIIELEVIADLYPNLKANNPNVEFHVILEGKKGSLKAGYVTTTGTVILF
jgi:hypothetical protein